LRLLSGQIAISLENAELYQNLEDRVLRRTQIIEQQKKELEESKRQSDELLLNILPAEVAEELKTQGKSQTKRFQSVSIIFTDFVEFTRMSEGLSPEELIEVVDEQYKAFDNITEKHGVEKIKTIGDAYMCVSGLPVEDPDNAIKAVRAAWEMMAFVAEYGQRRKEQGLPFCEMRIGIHTGPVVAGVVGYKKFAYDIWGDSVNTAARMESAGEPGKINISQTTYEAVKDRIKCSYRGKIQAKNKGEIEMYFVDEV
jgi:class 3 adenylate cyclase